MRLGNFSVSLAVKDLAASRAFYEKLGFRAKEGTGDGKTWMVLQNEDCTIGLGATEHALVPDGSILRLARIVGLGRAKELTLLNDWMRADEARAMGLVNWVVPPAELDKKLAAVVARTLESSRTANGHAKRLLHESFHTDPRAMLEEVLRAQADCMASPEMEEANRAWVEKRPARYFRPRA